MVTFHQNRNPRSKYLTLFIRRLKNQSSFCGVLNLFEMWISQSTTTTTTTWMKKEAETNFAHLEPVFFVRATTNNVEMGVWHTDRVRRWFDRKLGLKYISFDLNTHHGLKEWKPFRPEEDYAYGVRYSKWKFVGQIQITLISYFRPFQAVLASYVECNEPCWLLFSSLLESFLYQHYLNFMRVTVLHIALEKVQKVAQRKWKNFSDFPIWGPVLFENSCLPFFSHFFRTFNALVIFFSACFSSRIYRYATKKKVEFGSSGAPPSNLPASMISGWEPQQKSKIYNRSTRNNMQRETKKNEDEL